MQHCTHQVHRLPSSAAVVGASSLRRIDYADAHLVQGAPPTSAREWARAVLEQAPAPLRARLLSGWKTLGLRPAPAAVDTVLGWAVSVAEPDLLVLARRSWVGMPGELVFRTGADGLVFSTLVHHAHPLARLVWAAVVPSHVRTVEHLLAAGAARRVAATAP